MGMHIGLIAGDGAAAVEGQLAVGEDDQDIAQVITAFIPLATTGEVALCVGALAAVEHKLWLHGPVGAGAWVAGGATDHGSCL